MMPSINVEALQSVHLKKAPTPSTVFASASASASKGLHHVLYAENDAERERETREYFFSTGVDEWYDSLSPSCTFPSHFAALTLEESRVLIRAYEEQLKRKSKGESGEQDDQLLLVKRDSGGTETGDCDSFERRLSVNTVIPKELHDLVRRIQLVMTTKFEERARFFVKLSTRSPKDSKLLFEKAADSFKRRIDQNIEEGVALDENNRWIMLTEEVAKASAVNDAIQAIEFFIDSERIYEDLLYAMEEVQNMEFKWAMTIVVRAWDPRVTLQSEFRGFCWNRRLTCMGQYFHPLYFPELAQHREIIIADCLKLFDQIKSSLPVPNGLVDFAWLGPSNVLLIEVNPLTDCLGSFSASTGLFDYEVDKDLIQGVNPDAAFELRLREAPEDTMKLKIKSRPEWRNLVYFYRAK